MSSSNSIASSTSSCSSPCTSPTTIISSPGSANISAQPSPPTKPYPRPATPSDEPPTMDLPEAVFAMLIGLPPSSLSPSPEASVNGTTTPTPPPALTTQISIHRPTSHSTPPLTPSTRLPPALSSLLPINKPLPPLPSGAASRSFSAPSKHRAHPNTPDRRNNIRYRDTLSSSHNPRRCTRCASPNHHVSCCSEGVAFSPAQSSDPGAAVKIGSGTKTTAKTTAIDMGRSNVRAKRESYDMRSRRVFVEVRAGRGC